MVARATAAKYASLRRKVLGWRGKWPDVGKNMHKTNLTDGFGCWESLTSVKCLGIVKAVASPNNQLPMRRGRRGILRSRMDHQSPQSDTCFRCNLKTSYGARRARFSYSYSRCFELSLGGVNRELYRVEYIA